MNFPPSFFGFQLRPVALFATGISAAAVTASVLFYRYGVPRVLDRQRRVDAATQTDVVDGVDQHRDSASSIPEEPFIPPTICGPLARIWHVSSMYRTLLTQESCQDLDRTHKSLAYTYENWCSYGLKLVEIKLQHKSLYNGLESEHWWVLSNSFYNIYSEELPPQYFACARAVACIKRIGASISEAKVYLHTESAHTSVQDISLQTRVCKTDKCVFVDSDGHFWSHHSSHTHILETPAPFGSPTRRRGPPPGF